MSYRTIRRTFRELSLDQLERVRAELVQAARASRSPARHVKLEGQLQIVQEAIDRAYEIMDSGENYSMCA